MHPEVWTVDAYISSVMYVRGKTGSDCQHFIERNDGSRLSDFEKHRLVAGLS